MEENQKSLVPNEDSVSRRRVIRVSHGWRLTTRFGIMEVIRDLDISSFGGEVSAQA